MKTLLNTFTLTFVAFLGACQGTAPVIDQRPDFVPDAQVSSVQWIGNPGEGYGLHWASAVAVSPHHLLTNAHVWADEDPWWESEFPAQQEMALYEPAFVGHANIGGKRMHITRSDRLVKRDFRLVASGLSSLEAGPEGKWTTVSLSHGDWALIETDTPSWDADDLAFIHPPAMDPSWRVPEGTELFVLGFSSIFEEESSPQSADRDSLSSSSDVASMSAFIRAGPYTLRGNALTVDGDCHITYPLDWPQPSGHSGGGVYLWNAPTERLELVGIFHSWIPVTSTSTQSYSLLGISALSLEHTFQEKKRVLGFSPIATASQALAKLEG